MGVSCPKCGSVKVTNKGSYFCNDCKLEWFYSKDGSIFSKSEKKKKEIHEIIHPPDNSHH
jgi:uncharacterized Zn finger protein (UPF0148 family)